MRITKDILLLVVLQGLLPGCLCQRWTFPDQIKGLVGSCVEIPCTFIHQGNSEASSTVWYQYSATRYLQVFNIQGSSSVLKGYKDRTSLVAGDNSCSLRIDPVRKDDDEDLYYPGIAEQQETNAWTQSRRTVELHVTDTPELPKLIGKKIMEEGVPEIVICFVEHTCGSSPPSLTWNKPGQTQRQSEDLSRRKWREISRLQYIPLYEDDKTPIQCKATHHNGRTSQSAGTLSILYKPKEVTVSLIGNTEPLEGSDVSLRCFGISKSPPHRYEWYSGNNKTKLRHQSQTIVVRNVSKDTEPYSCAAINEVGRGESPPTEIPVQYAATGVQVIKLQQTKGVTELKCSFERSRPNVTHYTWIKDGTSVYNETGQILVLDRNEDKSGSYSCIAHNTAGSSKAEQEFNDSKNNDGLDDGPNLLLILGVSTGVIILLFLVMIVFFCARRKRKPNTPLSPVHGEVRPHFPTPRNQEETFVEEHQYGNIQVHPKVLPRSNDSRYSSHASEEQSFAIYSNEKPRWAETDIEYSTIAYSQHGRRQNVFDGDHQGNDINYAEILKKK